jgi:hypothetical protein
LSRWLWVATIAVAPLSLGACAPPCSSVDDEAVIFDGGTTNASRTRYETSPFDGQYLHFPGGRRYEILHHLAAKPVDITTYLAFQERPLPGSNLSESAGNQAVIEAVDEQQIQVFNDTCSEFYLRLTATTDPTMSDGGTPPSDSGTD